MSYNAVKLNRRKWRLGLTQTFAECVVCKYSSIFGLYCIYKQLITTSIYIILHDLEQRGFFFLCRVHLTFGAAFAWWYADLCKDPDREDHHPGSGAIRYYWERKGKDSGQGGYPPWPAASYLCWQAAGGWTHLIWLQHSERINPPLGSSPPGRFLNIPLQR